MSDLDILTYEFQLEAIISTHLPMKIHSGVRIEIHRLQWRDRPGLSPGSPRRNDAQHTDPPIPGQAMWLMIMRPASSGRSDAFLLDSHDVNTRNERVHSSNNRDEPQNVRR